MVENFPRSFHPPTIGGRFSFSSRRSFHLREEYRYTWILPLAPVLFHFVESQR
jgi:hypothetical protein